MSYKTCRNCNLNKPVNAFYKRRQNKGGFRTECKACHAVAGQKSYIDNKAYRDLAHSERNLIANYGLDLIAWEALFAKQKGVCAICEQPEIKFNNKSGRTQKLCVDHNHETNIVRGLLCNRCNRVLGLVKEDSGILNRMIQYVCL